MFNLPDFNIPNLRIRKHCLCRVYASARQTHEIVLADRLCIGRSRPNATNFEPIRKQVDAWQRWGT